jgi:hypothetical protein
LPLPMVPLPFVTMQVWLGVLGSDSTETLYESPDMSAVGKVNVPLAAIGKSSPPLFCNTRFEPLRPVTLPPTVNCDAAALAVVSVLPTPPEHAASKSAANQRDVAGAALRDRRLQSIDIRDLKVSRPIIDIPGRRRLWIELSA